MTTPAIRADSGGHLTPADTGPMNREWRQRSNLR